LKYFRARVTYYLFRGRLHHTRTCTRTRTYASNAHAHTHMCPHAHVCRVWSLVNNCIPQPRGKRDIPVACPSLPANHPPWADARPEQACAGVHPTPGMTSAAAFSYYREHRLCDLNGRTLAAAPPPAPTPPAPPPPTHSPWVLCAHVQQFSRCRSPRGQRAAAISPALPPFATSFSSDTPAGDRSGAARTAVLFSHSESSTVG
jgi:hypothetical protein